MCNPLDKINKPEDLKNYSPREINELAAACRDLIINTVSANGGHLASNLGVVELTLCLAKVFNFVPGGDRLIFDVGHQAYTWKLITGRKERFAHLRQQDGLSGFPKRSESPFDFYNAGHSSTAISIALGYARADNLDRAERHNIALVGDGALTGGMSFEALNDAGQSSVPLKIIVNDNQMSIDQNVGGLSTHLDRLRISSRYLRIKKAVKRRILALPHEGGSLRRFFSNLKSKMRTRLHEESIYFENLGFRYYGPVDGHDVSDLLEHLKAIKDYDKPVVLHVVTQKGYGYKPAEDSPARYHGVAPFVIETGENSNPSSGKSFTSYVSDKLCDLGREDSRVFAITAAMAQGTGLVSFHEFFPERFVDTGIAEQHATSLAAGLALAGKRPFLALYSTFSQRAVDQILHDICLDNLPVCILVDRAGLVGSDGETHQGLYDVAIMKSFPNLKIYAPADAKDVNSLMQLALTNDGPMVIRYPKSNAPKELPLKNRAIDEYRLIKEGGDYTMIVFGALAEEAVEAHRLLKGFGIKGQLYSAICGKIMQNHGIISSLKKTGKLIIVEDAIRSASFAEQTEQILRREGVNFDTLICAVEDPLREQASRSELLAAEQLDAPGLASRIVKWIGV